MASLGLPGLAGFWGEFPALLSAYSPRYNEEVFRVYLVVAAVGTVLAAGYLLWMFQRTAFGVPTAEFAGLGVDGDEDDHGHGGHGHDAHGDDALAPAHSLSAAVNDLDDHGAHGDDEHEKIHDVGLFEWLAWTPFILGILVLGIYPQLLFQITDPAVTGLLDRTFGK